MNDTNSIIPDLLNSALSYLAHGWTPVPTCRPSPAGGCLQHGPDCEEPGKRPLLAYKHPRHIWGQILPPLIDQPPNKLEIDYWFEKWPDANLAVIVPPGYVVLDIDNRNFGDETAFYLGLTNLETVTHLTPGGQHLFFKADDAPGYAMLGPGLEVLGPGHLCHVPPSVGINGREYQEEYGFEEVEIADWPKKAPHLGNGTGGYGAACGGFWSNAIDDCLIANGYDINETIDPEQLDRAMAEIEARGAPEGRRFHTLKGILRWHWTMGASYPELEALGLAFAERCSPSYTMEAIGLLKWIKQFTQKEETEGSGDSGGADAVGEEDCHEDEQPNSQDSESEEEAGGGYHATGRGTTDREVFKMLWDVYHVKVRRGRTNYLCPFCYRRDELEVRVGKCLWECKRCKVGGGIYDLAMEIEARGYPDRRDVRFVASLKNVHATTRTSTLSDGDWHLENPREEYLKEVCGNNGGKLLGSKEKNAILHLPFDCNCWACEKCGKRFKWKSIVSLLKVTAGEFYARHVGPTEKIGNTKKRLRRHGVEYQIIDSTVGKVILTSEPEDGAERVEYPVQFLDIVIPSQAAKNPLKQASRAWKQVEAKSQESGDWNLITLTSLQQRHTAVIAEQQGFKVRGRAYHLPDSCDFDSEVESFKRVVNLADEEMRREREREDDIGMAAD